MPSPQKQVYLQTFSGAIDATTAVELRKSDTYEYGLNINVLSTANGNVGIVTNLKGNVLVPKSKPSGRCRTIGWARDEEVNKLYEFLWNENGYHTIYQYDGITNSCIIVMQNITDTGGLDILKWTERDLILMTDVVRNALLYWVKKGSKASKINVKKALDKSSTGYGIITEEFVNAYKLAPIVAPTIQYYSDTNVNVNRLYGTLIKTAVRHIFDDFEQSNYSDYSDAVVPSKEAFTGVKLIPTDNNAIKITVPTGSAIVKRIEIVMQYTTETGLSQWVLIATLDKDKLSIGDNSTYTYTFYNDGSYPVIDQEKIIRPYSFLPRNPLCQAFTLNAMVYANFDAGSPVVDIDMYFSDPIYEPLFLDDAIDNKFNEPKILVEVNNPADDDYINPTNPVTLIDGTQTIIGGRYRARKYKLTIGSDVKKGNIFNLRFQNGYGPDTFVLSYEAKNTDTATSVANKLKQMIIDTGRALKQTPSLSADIYSNTNSGGDISFFFILRSSPGGYQYMDASWGVNPVQFSTLKDTGVSVQNHKMGDTTKYGIVYEDDDTRRSLTYTDVNLVEKIDSQNEQGGMKKVTLILNINHKPPIWAKKYQIVRTASLTYDFSSLLQMVVQKVIDVPLTDQVTGDYLDLLVGSLYTYQKIHPNTTLKYEFKKGDRIRFISKEDGSYYEFFETEILSYNPMVTSVIEQNAEVNGTDSVEVGETNEDNIGSYIIIDGSERLIIDVTDSTHYQMNYPIGEASATSTFLQYTIVNRRGAIRIRKPNIDLEDLSLVEIFTPSSVISETAKQFYHFNKKFDIIDWGLETRQHYGDLQIQTDSQPAKVSITEGTVYVRSREMPITNELPAQVTISTVEDPSYSDFYYSLINSNGKTNVEDTGDGVVHFGSRFVFSNNYIEDTRINGLNDFDNLDRRDYNDKYGDVKLIVFTENELLVFKELKYCAVPVFRTIITDNADQELVGTSNKLLNDIRYYAHQGGIGANPESYFSRGIRHYSASTNSGCFVRLSRDGITPISEAFFFDNVAKELLRSAAQNGAFIFGGFDEGNNVAVFGIEDYAKYTMNSDFNEAQWKILDEERPEDTLIEILTQPTNGTATLDGTFAEVTNDGTVGSDSFTYRVLVDGEWLNRKVCMSFRDPANRQAAWRAKESSYVCSLNEGGLRTGYKEYILLEEYYTDDNSLIGNEKGNVVTSADYVSPVFDDVTCVPEIAIYYNVEKSAFAVKNDCGDGYVGSEEEYVIPAGTYSSEVSQEEADNFAQDAANGGAQGHANEVGTCEVEMETYVLSPFMQEDGGITNSIRAALKNGSGVNVTVSANITMDYQSVIKSIIGDVPMTLSGTKTLLSGLSTVLLDDFDNTVYYYVGTDITNIIPSVVDGHPII